MKHIVNLLKVEVKIPMEDRNDFRLYRNFEGYIFRNC